MAEIRLLGPVQVVTSGGAVDVGPPQRRAVLAALAVDAGAVVAAETLIDRVWGQDPPAGARRSLHAHVARLRRLLGEPALVRRAGGYVLEIPAAQVDLHCFHRLLANAPGEALSLWRGEPLAGLGGIWAERVRHGLRQRYLDAVIGLARNGNGAGMISQLTELAAENPFHEPLVAALMRALQAGGNVTAALDLYSSTRTRLVEELGIEPGAELVEAHQSILRGGATVAGWPRRFGVVPPAADCFQHRRIAAALSRPAAAHVFSGLGGVGKTQLAAQAARDMWQERGLDLLLWVSAASRDAVVSAYAQTSSDLALGPGDETPEDAAARLLAWLAATEVRWLVVLDDVASPADVRGLWPPDHPTGRTLVTTRRRDASLLSGRALVEVGVFTEQEAVDYLARKLPHHLADDIPGVAADLGSLPLALSHAAAYMVDQDLTCSAYRKRFADRNRRLPGLFPDPETLFDTSPRTVATTWTLSIEAADRLAPAGLARPLLELASHLDANGIPDGVFTTAAARAYLGSAGPEEVRDGLRGLYRFHLITHEDGLVRVHALLQRAVRENLTSLDAAKAAADALVQCWPEVDVRTGQTLRANSAALQRVADRALWESGVHPVLLRTIDSLGAAAQLNEAIRLCREFGDHAAEQLGPAHQDSLGLLNKLAAWLGDAGRLREAIGCLQRLVVDVAKALGPDHPSALDARQNLGYQYGQAGDLTKAVTELTVNAADRVRVLGEDDVSVFVCLDQLAYWQGKAGDVAGAVATLEDLRPRAVRVLGPAHIVTLDIRANLARWLGERGDHDLAAAAFDELLTAAERVLGAAHRDVSVYRHNAAYSRWRAGDAAGAAKVFQGLLAQRLRMFGPKHRDTLATRHFLACVQAELADPVAAAMELEQAVTDMIEVFGPVHPSTLHARGDLADLWGRIGDAGMAATALEEVLADQVRVLGETHRVTVTTREHLDRWRGLAALKETS